MNKLCRRISEAVNAALGLGPVSVEEGPHRLTLQLTSIGPGGVAFDALDFVANDRADLSLDAVRAWGDRIAGRLTYLMEPLVVLEVDPVGGDVELRSRTPSTRDDVRSFYEIHLRRDGSLNLRRFAFDSSDRTRGVVPCRLTGEALERLVDDLVATLDPA